MTFFRDLTIRKKFTILLMSTSTLAVLLASLSLYGMLIDRYRELYHADLIGLARVLGYNCKAALAFDVPEDAQQILTSLRDRPSIIVAQIHDADDREFASYTAPVTNNPGNRVSLSTNPPFAECFAPDNSLRVCEDIILDGRVLGSIVLVDDIRSIKTFNRMALVTLLIIISAVLTITFFLAARFRDIFAQPLTELVTLSHRVSEQNDYSQRARKHGADEVGELVDSFNNMLDRIAARDAELRASEKRFRGLIDQAADAIFLHDNQGRIIDVNQRACCSIGFSREELLTMNMADIDLTANIDSYKEKYWSMPCSEPPFTIEGTHRCKNGMTFPVEVRMGRMELDDQELIVALARDISERRHAEAERQKLETQLQQAQKMESIGTLASGIAHDFNNILSPIFGYIELAMVEMPEDHKLKPYLSEVYRAAQRAKELVKQILTFSREEVQQRSLVEIQIIIKEALKLLRASIPTSIEITQQIDPNCGLVLANPTQIHQILMNLCTNAYHAMREKGGVLSVSLTPVEITTMDAANNINLAPGTYLRLEVSDTGHGIAATTLDRIFEPYFTTKGKGEGTGMGLSVVHGIVTSHGGHILVRSEQGKGSIFQVYLPQAQKTVVREQVIEDEPIARGTEKILIVDDEEMIINVEEQMLESLGYRVTAFTDSIEALEAFKQEDDYDLVLTDMTMPRMTGDRLAREILDFRPDTPIILCTGYSEMINEKKAKDIGVRKFVTKPLVFKELSSAVRKTLDEVKKQK